MFKREDGHLSQRKFSQCQRIKRTFGCPGVVFQSSLDVEIVVNLIARNGGGEV